MRSLSEFEHRRQPRRAVIASTIGTTIEWYDFVINGTATGFVFGRLYFRISDPLAGTIQAFAIYYIRLGIRETAKFAQPLAENKAERTPFIEVIGRQYREILPTALVRLGEQAPFCICTAFFFTYRHLREPLSTAVLAILPIVLP